MDDVERLVLIDGENSKVLSLHYDLKRIGEDALRKIEDVRRKTPFVLTSQTLVAYKEVLSDCRNGISEMVSRNNNIWSGWC